MQTLPRLLLIADGFTRPDIAERAKHAVECGVPWIQLRDHDASTDAFEFACERFIKELRRVNPKVLISINSRITVSEAQGVPLHTGFHGVSVTEALNVLGSEWLVGASIHSRFEAVDAERDGAKYSIFSPVFETPSHPGERAWGTDVLKSVCSSVQKMQVLAMGGITPERVPACLQAGAYGVAVHFSIMGALNIPQAVMDFRKALRI